ncbi:hypothetical protein [Mobilicoccus pelagius]|uniref:hypothetical protein n=1 Tax=Mobilicoccus pelagius TaxID=746032 RepID=UPI00031BE198|nr:hypothetical protein [Mobilicoccus pelagius]
MGGDAQLVRAINAKTAHNIGDVRTTSTLSSACTKRRRRRVRARTWREHRHAWGVKKNVDQRLIARS